jgi:hypothetical protein
MANIPKDVLEKYLDEKRTFSKSDLRIIVQQSSEEDWSEDYNLISIVDVGDSFLVNWTDCVNTSYNYFINGGLDPFNDDYIVLPATVAFVHAGCKVSEYHLSNTLEMKDYRTLDSSEIKYEGKYYYVKVIEETDIELD